MKRKRIWWVIGTCALVAVVFFVVCSWRTFCGLWSLMKVPFKMSKIELVAKDGTHRLYLKERYWTYTRERHTIVISVSPRLYSYPDTTSEYAYVEPGPFFYYTFVNDTLRVYTPNPSPVPPDLHTPITVIQVQLNSDDCYELATTYEQKGLKRIPWPLRR